MKYELVMIQNHKHKKNGPDPPTVFIILAILFVLQHSSNVPITGF